MSLDKFYSDRDADTKEEKIGAMERQLQQTANHQMDRDKWLTHLEGRYAKMINCVGDVKPVTQNWADKYKMVNDSESAGGIGATGSIANSLSFYGKSYYNPLKK